MSERELHILIVDDNAFYRQGLKMHLKRLCPKCTVMELSDGQSFIDYISSTYTDLVFMDIKMPGMDGIQATKKALTLFREIKIIALTMFANHQYLLDMIAAGAKGYLIKDFDPSELNTAITNVLNGGTYYSKNALSTLTSQ